MNMVLVPLQESFQERRCSQFTGINSPSTNQIHAHNPSTNQVRVHNLLALLPMREKSKVKEYIPGDFEKLVDDEREMWLADQCSHFEEEINSFYDENDNFVEELSKKLRKVTRRWTSWKHQSFGAVNSIDLVRDLLVWERQNQPKTLLSNQTSIASQPGKGVDQSSSNNKEVDPLQRFESYLDKSSKLLHIFRQDIYRPLCDFYCDDDYSDGSIKEIPRNLEKCVQRWEALLQFSPVNEKLFNKSSEKFITTLLRSNRISDSDTVIRLVPDLYQKKLEVLRLANKWRLVAHSKIIQRRGTYTISPRPLEKRETMPRFRALAVSTGIVTPDNQKSYNDINQELKKTRRYYVETNKQLKDTQDKCERVVSEMETCKLECEKLREKLQHTAELRKAIEMKVHDSYMSHGRSSSNASISLEESNNEESHDALWEKELERIKTKYSHQKVKYLNSRKQVENLNKQLGISQERCSHLQNSLESISIKFSALEEQLELARKNIQIQGNMVDALQHQCFTLKQELDTSNIKKGELYTQLSDNLERYQSVESDLKQAKQRCKQLVDESTRWKTREEELERENTQLRRLVEVQGTRRRSNDGYLPTTPVDHVTRQRYSLPGSAKETHPRSPSKNNKDCIFPDINAGHSF